MTDMTVKFAKGSDDIIEGYGVPFGPDLDGQQFNAETDRCPDWFPNGGRPILVDHGFDPTIKFHSVGSELTTEATEEGDWVRAQLDKSSKYYARVSELVRQGKMGWSSAAPDHKVKIAKDGTIERWPVIEYSLTTTPAKPNNVAFAMKSAQVMEVLETNDTEIPDALRDIEQAHEGDSEPESHADHAERVLAGAEAIKTWVERMLERSGARMKAGRELSQANIETLRKAHQLFGEAHQVIGDLLERNDKPSEDEKRAEAAKAARAEFLRQEADRLIG